MPMIGTTSEGLEEDPPDEHEEDHRADEGEGDGHHHLGHGGLEVGKKIMTASSLSPAHSVVPVVVGFDETVLREQLYDALHRQRPRRRGRSCGGPG